MSSMPFMSFFFMPIMLGLAEFSKRNFLKILFNERFGLIGRIRWMNQYFSLRYH